MKGGISNGRKKLGTTRLEAGGWRQTAAAITELGSEVAAAVAVDLAKKQGTGAVDGGKVEADVLVEIGELAKKAGVGLAEVAQNLLNGVALSPAAL